MQTASDCGSAHSGASPEEATLAERVQAATVDAARAIDATFWRVFGQGRETLKFVPDLQIDGVGDVALPLHASEADRLLTLDGGRRTDCRSVPGSQVSFADGQMDAFLDWTVQVIAAQTLKLCKVCHC